MIGLLNPFDYLKTSLLSLAAIWLCVAVWQNYKNGQLKFSGFRFSVKNYYLLTGGLAVYPIAKTLIDNSLLPLLIFLAFGFFGMLLEILISEWWRVFYKNRLYTYAEETLEHGYSSWLNVLPWGAGAMMFLALTQQYQTTSLPGWAGAAGNTVAAANVPFYFLFLTIFLICVALQMAIWSTIVLHQRHDHKFTTLNWPNFIFTAFPSFLAVAVVAALYGPQILSLAILFGVVAAVVEYFFGKTCQAVIGKKLWTYNYLSVDNGHFTPLAIWGFSLAGFYFWALGLIFQTLLR
ncbi:MAG: hypothetical protein KGJ93_01730 [Patescibacteria group bacterium]|nr:hypothetical protein [Patescibacteria group bacterium]